MLPILLEACTLFLQYNTHHARCFLSPCIYIGTCEESLAWDASCRHGSANFTALLYAKLNDFTKSCTLSLLCWWRDDMCGWYPWQSSPTSCSADGWMWRLRSDWLILANLGPITWFLLIIIIIAHRKAAAILFLTSCILAPTRPGYTRLYLGNLRIPRCPILGGISSVRLSGTGLFFLHVCIRILGL